MNSVRTADESFPARLAALGDAQRLVYALILAYDASAHPPGPTVHDIEAECKRLAEPNQRLNAGVVILLVDSLFAAGFIHPGKNKQVCATHWSKTWQSVVYDPTFFPAPPPAPAAYQERLFGEGCALSAYRD